MANARRSSAVPYQSISNMAGSRDFVARFGGMPTYDFSTEHSRPLGHPLGLVDGDGVDCPDDRAALREAALTATEMAKDALISEGERRSFTILVSLDGRNVGRVSVDVAIKVDPF